MIKKIKDDTKNLQYNIKTGNLVVENRKKEDDFIESILNSTEKRMTKSPINEIKLQENLDRFLARAKWVTNTDPQAYTP